MAQATQTKFDDVAFYERAGPVLLSMQPSEAKEKSKKDSTDWNMLRGKLESRLTSLWNWRSSWWSENWSDLATFIQPRRSIWLTQSAGGWPTPNNMTRGRPINSAIVDPTATLALRVCSGGLMSGLASPSRPWFKMMPSSRRIAIDSAARAWLDETEDRIYTVLAGSNFYQSLAQELEDVTCFGTAPTIIYEDEKDLIRCYNPAIGEYYLASGATNRVDGLYRLFVMTISQMVDFFGVANCPEEVQKLWSQKGTGLDMERMVAHSIEPNYAMEGTDIGKIPGNFTWREVYWTFGANSSGPLSMKGYVDQPFTATRWSTQSNDPYGRGPGMDVLPDVMQLQVMTRREAEAIEKQVRPPLVADMQLKNQPSSILPGHVTYVSGLASGTGMRPIYEVNPDIKAMSMNIMQIQERIKRGFFNDLFAMFSEVPQGKMTAYETAQRVQEKLSQVSPMIESFLSESLKPRLKRVFSIMKRKGFIDPPPDSLKGVALDVEFVSILALASKAAATGGLERLAALIGNMAAIYPDVVDNLDSDVFVDEMNQLLGNPSKILRGPKAVMAIRQQKQQQQQDQQKMMEAQHMAKTASVGADAAQTLSQTTVGAGKTALDQLLGTS